MKQLLFTLLLLSGYAFSQGGTTSSDLFPVTTGQNLGQSSKRWNVYAQNLNITGVVTCTGSCNLSTGSGSSTALLTLANTWTKNNTFPSITFTTYTVATLPSSAIAGTMAVVSDGQSATDCTLGAGSTTVNCRYTGSAWAALGSGSSNPISGATATALVTAATSTSIQTPAATATLDSSGNLQTPGTITAGYNDAHAGAVLLGQGTAWGTGTTAVLLTAPTSVTSYNIVFPSAAATGVFKLSNSSNIVTASIAAVAPSDATGNVQGNGSKFLLSSTVSGTGASLCTDASGNATTSGCSSGSGSAIFSGAWQGNTVTTGAGTRYNTISGAFANSGSEINAVSVNPVACTARNMYLVTSGANGTGTLTVTLRRGTTAANLADTTLTIAVGSGAAAGVFSDTTHTVSLLAGDTLSVSVAMGGAAQTSATMVGYGFQCN